MANILKLMLLILKECLELLNQFGRCVCQIKNGGIKMLEIEVKDFKITINDIISIIEATQLAIFQ